MVSNSGGATAWPTIAYARSINKQTCFYTFGFGERPQCVVAGIVVPLPRRNGSQLLREFGEQLRNFRILPELGAGGRINFEIIRKKCA